MGDVRAWLAEALKSEREELERRHGAILAELGERLATSQASGPREAFQETKGPSLPGQTNKVEQVPVAPSEQKAAHNAVADANSEHSDDSASEHVSMQLFKRLVKSGSVKGTLRKAVNSMPFELFFGFLIVFNTITLCVQVQHQGIELGHTLGYRWYDEPADAVWPGANTAFDVLGYFFGILFTIELILKVVGLRYDFLLDWWNYFDAAIVLAWYIELFGVMDLPIDSSVIRIFRLARLLRLLRLVRKMQGFDALYLMTTAMRGSGSILIWAVVLLAAVQIFVALAVNQVLHMSYFEDATHSIEDRTKVWKYFGTFSRSLLSCFEITVGNWVPVARALLENVNESFMIFSLAHKMVVGYAMIGIINGVFIQETFKVAATDDMLMVQRKAKMSKNHAGKMRKLFGATAGADGCITKKQFKKMVKEPYVSQWLSAMEFDVRDADAVFSLVDTSGDGEVSLDELGKGISKLKGPARSLDLAIMCQQQAELKEKLTMLLQQSKSA